jgi:glycosyltransferase involved in cell wall biosynthesis
MNLLLLVHSYTAWMKKTIEFESKFVNKIDVILHRNFLAEISNYLPFGGYFDHLRLYTKRRIVDLKRKPDNVEVHLIPLLYFIPDGRNKRLGNKLVRKFEDYIREKRMKFDLIHAHFIYPQGYVAVKLGQKFNVPVVISAHGHDVYEMPFRNNDWKSIIKQVLEQSNYIITTSHKNEYIIVKKLGINNEKVSVIPNGFDSQVFRGIPRELAREKLGLPKNKKIILNVGNLYPAKGHKYLIIAIKEIVEKRRDILCVIIGDGPLKKELRRHIEKEKLQKYIKLVGARPHDEIPLWMNAADLFVLPSLHEGNPTVMFEALGVGLPFIGTKVGGIPEVLVSEDYGFLVEPANTKDLVEKILISLEKDWDREKIQKYARKFTLENVVERILEIYKHVLSTYESLGFGVPVNM